MENIMRQHHFERLDQEGEQQPIYLIRLVQLHPVIGPGDFCI